MSDSNQNSKDDMKVSPDTIVEATVVDATEVSGGNYQNNQNYAPYAHAQPVMPQNQYNPNPQYNYNQSQQGQYQTAPGQYNSGYTNYAINSPQQQQSMHNYQNQGYHHQQQQTHYNPNYNQQNVQQYQNNPSQGYNPHQNMQVSHPPAGKYGFIHGRRQFMIKQRFEAIEAMAQAVGFDCIEQANKYDIFDPTTGENLYYVKESSTFFCRCCCAPNHEAKIYFYDSRHPQFNPKNLPKQGSPGSPLLMTVDKPFKLNCCVCAEICQHSQTATLADGSKIGSAEKSSSCGGGCTPEILVKDNAGKVFATVTGPCFCVGGIVELFDSVTFFVNLKDKKKVGELKKAKPSGFAALKEAAGDADQFFMSIPSEMTDEHAANFLATMLLLDYIFFEGGAPFEYDPSSGALNINCWNCYIGGCLWPCHCSVGGNSGD